MPVYPCSSHRYPDAVDLFESNPSTRGCWCQHPLLTVRETSAGWGAGNQRASVRWQSASAAPFPDVPGVGPDAKRRGGVGGAGRQGTPDQRG